MDEGYFHGINKLKKPGYKVIKPPGGQTNINIFAHDHEVKSSPVNACQAERNSSSIGLGNDNSGVRQNTRGQRNSSSIVFGGPELPPQQQQTPPPAAAPAPYNTTPQSAPPPPPPATNATPPKAEPSPSPPAQTNNNNVMVTPHKNDTSIQNNVRSSTKVMAPPGGRSSINLFG